MKPHHSREHLHWASLNSHLSESMHLREAGGEKRKKTPEKARYPGGASGTALHLERRVKQTETALGLLKPPPGFAPLPPVWGPCAWPGRTKVTGDSAVTKGWATYKKEISEAELCFLLWGLHRRMMCFSL